MAKQDNSFIFAEIMNIVATGTMPWNVPWIVSSDKNAFTKKAYRGMNKMILGYHRKMNPKYKNLWLTFNQAKKFAPDTKFMEKGQTSVCCQYFMRYEDKNGQEKVCPKSFFLFNISQFTEEFQTLYFEKYGENSTQEINDSEIDEDVSRFCESTNLNLEYKDNVACYIPATHTVFIPPHFTTHGAKYSTLFHELTHSTAKELKREVEGYHSDRNVRSVEEMVAEFGAAILCSEYGIKDDQLNQSASYIKSWSQMMTQENIISAFKAAEKSAQYYLKIVGRINEQDNQEE